MFPAMVSISSVKNKLGKVSHYVAVLTDITVMKDNEAKLIQLAHYDQLTDLVNRSLFYTRLDEEISRARRQNKYIAVMYIDLDGFKQVKDTLGHDAGDSVLAEAARILRNSKRAYDIAARLGGDEFALILTDIEDIEIISTLADRVVKKLDIKVEGAETTLQVTGSIGVAIYPEHGEDSASLVRNADAAMYIAKQQGKNAFNIYSDA